MADAPADVEPSEPADVPVVTAAAAALGAFLASIEQRHRSAVVELPD